MIIGLFSFSLKGVTTYADSIGLAPGEDPSIYNTEWTQANVKYWNIYGKITPFGGIRTVSYIRITDQKGNFITNVTRLKASYIIDGKKYTRNKDISDKGFQDHMFTMGNVLSKDGQFTICTERDNNICFKKKFKDFDKAETDFEECNFKWMWNFKVSEIVYLYVWYLDPETGNEVASSFMPNGAHPLYDENGVLKGIYDANGNPLDDYSMGADGIIEDETGKDLVQPEDQFVGQIESSSFFKTASETLNKILDTITIIFSLIIGIVIFMVFIRFFKKIINLFKR